MSNKIKLSFIDYLDTIEAVPSNKSANSAQQTKPIIKPKVIDEQMQEKSKKKENNHNNISREWANRAAQICEGVADMAPPSQLKNMQAGGGVIHTARNPASKMASHARDLM